MSFQETVNSLINDGYECALTMEKCNIFAESVIREYNINCEEAELKVLKESGTDEDFKYLREAAKEGLVVKLKKAIKKMIQAIKDFIANMVDKIKVTYASKKSKDAMDRIEEACKTNPKLKSMKITVHDGEKDEKAILEAIDKMQAQKAKLKGGDSVEKVAKAIDDIKENTEKKRQKIAKVATLTLGIGAAIALARKYIKKLEDENAEGFRECHKMVDEMDKTSGIDAEDDRVCQQLFHLNSSLIVLCKERASSILNFVRELCSGAKGKMAVPNLEESVDDTMEVDTYSESYDDDIYTPATTVEEDIDDNEVHVDESYIDSMFADIESSVTTESEDESTDTEDTEDVSYESTLDAYLDHLMEDSDSDNVDDVTTENSVSELDAMLDDITSDFTTESEDVDIDSMLDDITSDVTTESSNDDADVDNLLDELVASI